VVPPGLPLGLLATAETQKTVAKRGEGENPAKIVVFTG